MKSKRRHLTILTLLLASIATAALTAKVVLASLPGPGSTKTIVADDGTDDDPFGGALV